MKNFLRFWAILMIAGLTFAGCGSNDMPEDSADTSSVSTKSKQNKRDADFLPPLEIDIPKEIKSDKELVNMVKSSEKAINEFSDNLERIAKDGKKFLGKKEEEQSIGDGLRAAKLMIEFGANSSQMAAALQEFETYMDGRENQENITEEQIEALEEVGEAFKARMEEVAKKYEDFFDEN